MSEAVSHSRCDVVVVDDVSDTADSLAELLRIAGYTAIAATSGAAALLMAESLRPRAILLDIGMPAINGLEVCRRIRQQPWGGSIIIIANTGWTTEQMRAAAAEAGFDRVLLKPTDFTCIDHVLDSLLRRE